jgi:hypothetical protein
MAIWIAGILFTFVFVDDPEEEIPWYKQVLQGLLIVTVWPVILGMEFREMRLSARPYRIKKEE